jgi:hypothetical protein
VHRGTKNSFPRAGGLKRFKRAFLGEGTREASSSCDRDNDQEESRMRGADWRSRRKRGAASFGSWAGERGLVFFGSGILRNDSGDGVLRAK